MRKYILSKRTCAFDYDSLRKGEVWATLITELKALYNGGYKVLVVTKDESTSEATAALQAYGVAVPVFSYAKEDLSKILLKEQASFFFTSRPTDPALTEARRVGVRVVPQPA